MLDVISVNVAESRSFGWRSIHFDYPNCLLKPKIEPVIMKRLHLAISTDNIEKTVQDYTQRLGVAPCSCVAGQYALWRTECFNLSVRQDASCAPGSLRHLGWEDDQATTFTQETDVNGIVWERFSAAVQADEINQLWPEANYHPNA